MSHRLPPWPNFPDENRRRGGLRGRGLGSWVARPIWSIPETSFCVGILCLVLTWCPRLSWGPFPLFFFFPIYVNQLLCVVVLLGHFQYKSRQGSRMKTIDSLVWFGSDLKWGGRIRIQQDPSGEGQQANQDKSAIIG
jgi:hypothetical protein